MAFIKRLRNYHSAFADMPSRAERSPPSSVSLCSFLSTGEVELASLSFALLTNKNHAEGDLAGFCVLFWF